MGLRDDSDATRRGKPHRGAARVRGERAPGEGAAVFRTVGEWHALANRWRT